MGPDGDDVVFSRIECRMGADKAVSADDYQKRVDRLFRDNRRILKAVQREVEMMDRAVFRPARGHRPVRHARPAKKPWLGTLFFCC